MEPIRISYYIILSLSLVLSLLKSNRTDRTLHIFPVLIGLALSTQIIVEFLRYIKVEYVFVFNGYALLECILYGVYFYFLFDSVKLKVIIVASVLLFIIYFFLYAPINSESFGMIESIEALFMVVFSVIFYFNLLQKDGYTNLFRYPHFYINSANLIHFTISFIYYSFDSYFKSIGPEISNLSKLIPQFTNILIYLLYCIAFICQRIQLK